MQSTAQYQTYSYCLYVYNILNTSSITIPILNLTTNTATQAHSLRLFYSPIISTTRNVSIMGSITSSGMRTSLLFWIFSVSREFRFSNAIAGRTLILQQKQIVVLSENIFTCVFAKTKSFKTP